MLNERLLHDFNTMLQDLVSLIPAIETKILSSILVLLILWLVRRMFLVLLNRISHDLNTRYQMRKIGGYALAAIGVISIGWIWFSGIGSFTVFFGLISTGLVIAMKDLLIDLAGWMFIVSRRPFQVGDRIQIGDIAGDVIDIRVFQFTLLEIGNWVDADQSTGRVVHIPNGKIFVQPQANYTQGFHYIWNEIPVTITFDSNWTKAKEILLDIATQHTSHLSELARERLQKAADTYLIFYSKLTPIVYTNVNERGIVLTVRYLSEPRRRRGSAQEILEAMLHAFAHCPDISFAYPTQRFYNQSLEGPVRPYASPTGNGQHPDHAAGDYANGEAATPASRMTHPSGSGSPPANHPG